MQMLSYRLKQEFHTTTPFHEYFIVTHILKRPLWCMCDVCKSAGSLLKFVFLKYRYNKKTYIFKCSIQYSAIVTILFVQYCFLLTIQTVNVISLLSLNNINRYTLLHGWCYHCGIKTLFCLLSHGQLGTKYMPLYW